MKASRENKPKIRRKISKKAKEKKKKEVRAQERKLALTEKGTLPTTLKTKQVTDPVKTLSLSPSAGSQAINKKLDSQSSASFSATISKGVNISNIPTTPKEKMEYLRSKYPGLRNNPS